MLSLSKVRNVRSLEMFEMEFKFSKLVKIIVLRRLRVKKRLAAQSTVYVLCCWQGVQAF